MNRIKPDGAIIELAPEITLTDRDDKVSLISRLLDFCLLPCLSLLRLPERDARLANQTLATPGN